MSGRGPTTSLGPSMWPHGSRLWAHLGFILDLVDPIGPYLSPILGYYLGPDGPIRVLLGPAGLHHPSISFKRLFGLMLCCVRVV